MFELYRSDILMALGKAITDSFWQMSLLWLLYLIFVAFAFQRRPALRHTAASLLTIAGTAWFILGFGSQMSDPVNPGLVSSTDTITGEQGIIQYLMTALPYFSMAYLLVLIVLLARFAYQYMMMRALRVDLQPARSLQALVDRLAVSMAIDREILIHFSCHVAVPSTIGVLKPVILLPLATVNHLSPEQMEAVIIHEMAHIRRYDYLINMMVSVCSTLMFFNPFIHLLASIVRRDAELSCDDEVIRYRQDPQQYAQALLLLEKSKTKPDLLVAATGTPGLLVGRVKRILNLPEEQVKYRHKILALVCLAGLLMGMGHLLSVRPAAERQPSGIHSTKTMSGFQQTEGLKYSLPLVVPQKGETKKQHAKPGSRARVKDPAAPRPPEPPHTPPQPIHQQLTEFMFLTETPDIEAEGLPLPAYAPDPRDKRHPGILFSKDMVMIPDMPDITVKMPLDQLIQWQQQAESMKQFRNTEPQHEFLFIPKAKQLAEAELRKQVEKAGTVIRSSKARAKVRSFVPNMRTTEDGVTITILNSEEQIEIRVEEKARTGRN